MCIYVYFECDMLQCKLNFELFLKHILLSDKKKTDSIQIK